MFDAGFGDVDLSQCYLLFPRVICTSTETFLIANMIPTGTTKAITNIFMIIGTFVSGN